MLLNGLIVPVNDLQPAGFDVIMHEHGWIWVNTGIGMTVIRLRIPVGSKLFFDYRRRKFICRLASKRRGLSIDDFYRDHLLSYSGRETGRELDRRIDLVRKQMRGRDK